MSEAAQAVWRPTAAGVLLRVRLTPKASVDRIDGVSETADGPALAARVRAVPEDGQANAAAARLVADWLGMPKSSVSVSAGAKSRIKTLTIIGDTDAIAECIATRLQALTGRQDT